MRYFEKSVAWIMILSLFAGCQPGTDINGKEKPGEPDSYGELIGTFFVESRNMTLQLFDITDLYQEVCYINRAVPVAHTRYEDLPEALKETVKSYGLSFPTQVYRMKWKGETVYHLICGVMDDDTGVFKSSGERIRFASFSEYLQFLQDVIDVKCLLLINTELVKRAEGAPNLLTGTWQSDWLHLRHAGVDEPVALYSDLPFSMTEVVHFNADGTGYLRSVKTGEDGSKEAALDPFTYYLTNYHTNGANGEALQDYSYLCCFAAGDTIEYTARSREGFSKVFERAFYFVTYPWYRQASDPYTGRKGEPKYGIPEADGNSPIVGRWTGTAKSAARSFGINSYTWVFRSDRTGYLLIGRQLSQSFAYTVDGKAEGRSQLTLYKYDTGFTIDDGFWTAGDLSYSFSPQPVPQGKPMQVRIYDGGNSLELEGWSTLSADLSSTPIVFHRVEK